MSTRFTIYGVPTESWAKRFGIEVFTHPCSECGTPATTTIPFAQGVYRGLQAPPCRCGNKLTPYGMVRDPRLPGDLFTAPERKRRTAKRTPARVLPWRPRAELTQPS